MSHFRTQSFVCARLAGASVSKTATLLGVLRAAFPKVVTAYTDRGKTSSAKRHSGRKPKLSERHRLTLKRIVSENDRTAASKVTAELIIYLFPQEHSNESFTNPTSAVELRLLNFWLFNL